MATDHLRIEANERIDLPDMQFAVDEQLSALVQQTPGNFMTNPAGQRAWILDGFALDSPSGAQLRITKGRAILSRREGAVISHGVVTTEGDDTKIQDLAAFALGDYGAYIRFNFTDGDSESRVFWNASGTGSEFSQTIATRRHANWSMRVEASSPGAEWFRIANVEVIGGPALTITDERDFYFEGKVSDTYANTWGGGLDRDSDRAANGIKDLQEFTAMVRAQFEQLRPSAARWWDERGIDVTGVTSDETGVIGRGGATNGEGVEGFGAGTGTGVRGTAGGSGGVGVNGVGVTGIGVSGQGGPGTAAAGVFGAGGAAGSGPGVEGSGAATGAGVEGTGGSTSGSGVLGTGGTPNGIGIDGIGTGTGIGVRGTGGTNSSGVEGTGGTTDNNGVRGVGGATNGDGVRGEGTGTGEGVVGVGGSSGGVGVSGTAGAAGVAGVAGTNVAGGSGPAVIGISGVTSTGPAVHGNASISSGYGVVAEADATTPQRAALHLVGQNADPVVTDEGAVYYNNVADEFRGYNGAGWAKLDGNNYDDAKSGTSPTTVSASFAVLASMTTTVPEDGDYLILFSGAFSHSSTGTTTISVFVNAVEDSTFRRVLNTGSTLILNGVISGIAFGLSAGDTVDVRWATSSGTATCEADRELSVVQLQLT